METMKRDLLPHQQRALLPLESYPTLALLIVHVSVANGVIALLIGLHFVFVTVYLRIRYRKDGVGPEQRKALAMSRGVSIFLRYFHLKVLAKFPPPSSG